VGCADVPNVARAVALTDDRTEHGSAPSSATGCNGATSPEARRPGRTVVVIGVRPKSLLDFRGRLIEDMLAAGHRVFACAPGEDALVAEALQTMGAVYCPIQLDEVGLNPIADLRSIVELVMLFRRLAPDVVLTYTMKPLIYGGLAARVAGVPDVFPLVSGLGYTFIDGAGSRRLVLRRVMPVLMRHGLGHSRVIFVHNPDDKAELIRRGIAGSKQEIITLAGSGIDLEEFSVTPVTCQAPIFLLMARLTRDKGIVEYVEAARHVKARYPQTRFWLLGRFSRHPSALTRAEVNAWHEEGAIEYLGGADDVRPFLRACTTFVLPSYREGTPRSSLEAMATGRSIITTDVPGCRETVVVGENGFLVAVRDPAALAAAMEQFILSPELAVPMGRRSRQIAEERFDVRKVNHVMLEAMGLI
jgi:glycosyltransferase involved in cell wall biosynthesis